MTAVEVELKIGDVLAEKADVLVLKHAQALYGVDAAVVAALRAVGRRPALPPAHHFALEPAVSGVDAASVLFIGVPPLSNFGYTDIRIFAREALTVLAREAPQTRNIAITIHGAGYGLDEVEAFESEVAGMADAIRSGHCPEALTKITIVERNSGRAGRLASNLVTLLPDHKIAKITAPAKSGSTLASESLLASAGSPTQAKAHAFVAMPFQKGMDDAYHYGIQPSVRASGLLCERADQATFTGDVMERVKLGIRTASLVVADLTDANANVYLEVGYAWGLSIPTVLVVNGSHHLKFDTRGQRCLIYETIRDLEKSLTAELIQLRAAR